MKKPIISTELVLVTPAIAQEWLSRHNYTNQRLIRPRHVAFLAAAMKENRYRSGAHVEFVILDGTLHLVDGQHSLTAVIKSSLPAWFLVQRRQVANLTELRRVYASFGRELTRTPSDVLNGLGLPEMLGLSPLDTAILASALRWVLNDFQEPTGNTNNPIVRDIVYVADQAGNWRAAMQLYLEAIEQSVKYLSRPLRQITTVAVALATFNSSAETMDRASNFWCDIAHDDRLAAEDPRKLAVNFLARRTSGNAATSALSRIRGLATIWNAAYAGRPLTILHPGFAGMIGITLAGTEFKARHPAGRNAPGNAASRDEAGLPLAAREHE